MLDPNVSSFVPLTVEVTAFAVGTSIVTFPPAPSLHRCEIAELAAPAEPNTTSARVALPVVVRLWAPMANSVARVPAVMLLRGTFGEIPVTVPVTVKLLHVRLPVLEILTADTLAVVLNPVVALKEDTPNTLLSRPIVS